MHEEPCKTCVRWMDICDEKDTVQKMNLDNDTRTVRIVHCNKYEKRNIQEV